MPLLYTPVYASELFDHVDEFLTTTSNEQVVRCVVAVSHDLLLADHTYQRLSGLRRCVASFSSGLQKHTNCYANLFITINQHSTNTRVKLMYKYVT